MKLSDIKGEKALEVLADLIEPAAEIMTDKEAVKLFRSGQTIKGVSYALKAHKKACLTILALTDGADPETYQPNVLSLPMKLLEIFNDSEMMGLFTSQSQEEKTSSGSATESIEAGEA